MAITPLPAAPLPSDSTLQFNTKTFAWVAALEDWTDETNATATAVTASQVAAAASASASAASAVQSADQVALAAAQVVLATAQVDLAEDAADASEVSALAAAAATNAVLWVSGTTYSVGSLVFSPLDARIYRRIIAGAGTTDPSLDAVNWIQLVRVVDQDDVGTDANEIPLNQFLGTMAYQDYSTQTLGFLVADLPAAGTIGRYAHVTDGDSGLGWGDTVVNAGSPPGATPYLVFDNGTNWTVAGK